MDSNIFNTQSKFAYEITEKIKSFFNKEYVKEEDINSLEKELSKNHNINDSLSVPFIINKMKDLLINGNKKKVDFIEDLENSNIVQQSIDLLTQKKREKKVNSKKENIIEKLILIKIEAIKQNDKNSISDIDWIIKTLTEENIYEMSTPLNEEVLDLNDKENKNALDYLMIYSNLGDIKSKNNDFNKITKNSRFKPHSINDSNNNGIILKNNKSNLFGNILSPSLSAKIITLLARLDYPDFDIFELDQLLQEGSSVVVANEIFQRIGIFTSHNDIINSETLRNFIQNAVKSYSRKNAVYHNDLHASDVMQTLFTMIIRGDLQKKMKLDDFDIFVMLISALCHDIKHTGQNNTFHINTRSKIALRYNDNSVLENFHIAQTFKLMKKEELNILVNFKPEEYRILRRRIIKGILSTDMAYHMKVTSDIKSKIEIYNINKGVNFDKIFNVETDKLFDAQQCVLDMFMHSSDISNPAKSSKISSQWTERVYEEFFRQGDMEKKLNVQVSLFCDRNTTNINQAMIGFINFVVAPTFDIIIELIPEVSDYQDNLRGNLKKHENNYSAEIASKNPNSSK